MGFFLGVFLGAVVGYLAGWHVLHGRFREVFHVLHKGGFEITGPEPVDKYLERVLGKP